MEWRSGRSLMRPMSWSEYCSADWFLLLGAAVLDTAIQQQLCPGLACLELAGFPPLEC